MGRGPGCPPGSTTIQKCEPPPRMHLTLPSSLGLDLLPFTQAFVCCVCLPKALWGRDSVFQKPSSSVQHLVQWIEPEMGTSLHNAWCNNINRGWCSNSPLTRVVQWAPIPMAPLGITTTQANGMAEQGYLCRLSTTWTAAQEAQGVCTAAEPARHEQEPFKLPQTLLSQHAPS